MTWWNFTITLLLCRKTVASSSTSVASEDLELPVISVYIVILLGIETKSHKSLLIWFKRYSNTTSDGSSTNDRGY